MLNLTDYGYKILEPLHHNHLGGRQTYLAVEIESQKLVAVKQFSFAKPNSTWNGFKQLESEMKILQDLDHPHIARFVDTLNHESGLCLITEYIEGGDLTGIPLRRSKVLYIIGRLLDLLVYLQNQSPPVIHRDIKPQNVILDKFGEPHLIDFGLSSTIGNQTLSLTSAFGGTIGYMPLEQILKGKVNYTSDIYGLGALGFQLLIGPDTSLRDVIDARNSIPVAMLSGLVKPDIFDWFEKILAELPEDRYPNAEAAKEAWFLALERKPVKTADSECYVLHEQESYLCDSHKHRLPLKLGSKPITFSLNWLFNEPGKVISAKLQDITRGSYTQSRTDFFLAIFIIVSFALVSYGFALAHPHIMSFFQTHFSAELEEVTNNRFAPEAIGIIRSMFQLIIGFTFFFLIFKSVIIMSKGEPPIDVVKPLAAIFVFMIVLGLIAQLVIGG